MRVSAVLLLLSGGGLGRALLSTFSADTICVRVPPLPANASLAEELSQVLAAHWLHRVPDPAQLAHRLHDLPGMHDKSSYLRSLGDPYCRMIAKADLAHKTFRGTRVAAGFAVRRRYVQHLSQQLQRALGHTRPPPLTPPPLHPPEALRLSHRDRLQLAVRLLAPPSLLAMSALHRTQSPHLRRGVLLYRCFLVACFAFDLARVLCPLTVSSVSPYLSSIQEGDRLVGLGGRRLNTMTARDVQRALDEGEANSLVRCTMRRDRLFDVLVSRSEVAVTNVVARIADEGPLGYLSIAEFNDRTLDDVVRAIDVLRAEARQRKTELAALIIDLRGNGGGLISSACDVAALFLARGKVLSRIVANGGASTLVRSSNGRADTRTGLLLLVDGGTASASEILVTALRDNDRALSAGCTTVGKDQAQAIVRLSEGCGVVFSVRSFVSPLGKFMGAGVTPDMALTQRIDASKIRWSKADKKWCLP